MSDNKPRALQAIVEVRAETPSQSISAIQAAAMEREWRKIVEALIPKFGRAELLLAYSRALNEIEETRSDLVEQNKSPQTEAERIQWKWMGTIDDGRWPLHRVLLLISRCAPEGLIGKVLEEHRDAEEKRKKEKAQKELANFCPDCGEPGETRGHMRCQYPSEVDV